MINADIGLFRKFQVTERLDIQFHAEMFNLGNTPHFREPRSNTSSGNFMLVDRIRNTGSSALFLGIQQATGLEQEPGSLSRGFGS